MPDDRYDIPNLNQALMNATDDEVFDEIKRRFPVHLFLYIVDMGQEGKEVLLQQYQGSMYAILGMIQSASHSYTDFLVNPYKYISEEEEDDDGRTSEEQ